MSNRSDNNKPETSADRIRRRVDQIEEQRQSQRPKINPFTLISVGVILVLAIIMSNIMGN